MKSKYCTLLFLAALALYTGALCKAVFDLAGYTLIQESTEDNRVSKLFKRSDSESSYQDSASSHDSLTPIEDTDSAPSDHGRTFAPGNEKYHRKMYKFHDRKMKYHKTLGAVYEKKWNKAETEEHYAESNSSKKKKSKHRKFYKGLVEKNLQPGEKTARRDAIRKKNFPEKPDRHHFFDLTRDPKFVFNRRKGHHYLVGKMQPDEKENPKVSSSEQIKGTSTPSVDAQTLAQKKHEIETGKFVVPKQVKSPTSTSRSLPDVGHSDERAKVYYGRKSSPTSGRRLPVQRLGGGETNPVISEHSSNAHSSDGHSSGDSLKKPLLENVKRKSQQKRRS